MLRSDQESYANKQRAEDRKRRRIRELNDQLRQTLTGGRVLITPGVGKLGSSALSQILAAISQFDQFGPGNDPHDEHDFGAIERDGHSIFWKIDYYDRQLEYGSPDPSDPAVTARVLTIMLASEY